MTVQGSLFGDDDTLSRERERIRTVRRDGTRCEACHQHVQEYRWSLYSSALRALARTYHAGGTLRFVESKGLKAQGQGGDWTRLGLWGFVEQESEKRPDGGKSGWWRVTSTGESFLRGTLKVPKYVWVFDGERQTFDGPLVSIRDLVPKDFDYDAMMRGDF